MLAANDNHYRMVVRNAGNLVVFVGAGVNAAGRAESWQPGLPLLPDDRDVARHLAVRAELSNAPASLAEVAQLAIAVHGEPTVFGWIREILMLHEDSVTHRVLRGLAALPAKLEAAGLGAQYQLVVTSAYDAALEQAFEEFDVAVYRVASSGAEPGSFVHLPFEGVPTAIGVGAASDYRKFPIARDPTTNQMTMLRTVIVRTNGVVDDPAANYQDWQNNYVLTEDDYIGYLSGVPVEQVVPSQILAKLRQANYLFLGFTLADWRLRVFLQRIWSGPRLGRAKYWAVAPEPDELDEPIWNRAGVDLVCSGLTDYVDGLHAFLQSSSAVAPSEG